MSHRRLQPPTGCSRRDILHAAGTASVLGLAGCLSETDSDVDGAAAELIRDGFAEEGVDPPFETTLYANTENAERVRWAQLVRNELNETGLFDVSLEETEWGRHLDLLQTMGREERNALVCLNLNGGWDPHPVVKTLVHSDSTPPRGFNLNQYANAEVDALIDAGRKTSDQQQRTKIYEAIQEQLHHDIPLSVLLFQDAVVVARDVVDGFRTYPIGGGEYTALYAPHAGTYSDLTSGETELVGDVLSEITTGDPVEMTDTSSVTGTTLIYEGLVDIDFDGTVRPVLATSWEQLDDTTYRFELRDDVTFHNGEHFTADHVEHSLERYAETPRMDDVYDWYDHVEIHDDYELEIHLHRAYSPFKYYVGQWIVPLATADDLDLSETPIGTGPYQFDERDRGERWRLKRYDDHWFEGNDTVPATPPIETVTMRIVPDPAARQAALEAGETHLSIRVPTESIAGFEADPTVTVNRTPTSTFEFLAYPSYLPPFTSRKVRRGIDALLPRTRIVDEVYHGYGTSSTTLLSPLAGSFDDHPTPEPIGTDREE